MGGASERAGGEVAGMKRRGRHKAVKWLLICSTIIDWKEDLKEQNRGMSRKQFRELYGSIIAPKQYLMARPRRGGPVWKCWDYCIYGDTADGKKIFLYSDLPPRRYK